MTKVCTLLLLSLSGALCQTRTEELEEARSEHRKQLAPETNNRVEELLRRLKDDKIFERANYGYNGLGAKVGGLVTGGGFAFGPQYLRDDLKDGAVVIRAAAQITFQNYQKAEGQLLLPRLLKQKAAFDLRAGYRNYPGINYYGPGPDSPKVRTNYRLENSSIDGTFGVFPFRFVRVGGGLGLLSVNVGRGTDDRFISNEGKSTTASYRRHFSVRAGSRS